MEQVIWVEVLARHHDVVSRTRCTGPVITIGRAYDNDVVIDDPHVAPNHLRIERDTGGMLVAVDLGTKNGVILGDEGRRQDRVRIDGATPVIIGGTALRIRPSNFAVAPESPMPDGKNTWIRLAVFLTLLFAYSLIGSWMEDSKPFKAIHYGGYVFSMAFFLAVWVGGWSILSRIFAGATNFQRHLKVAITLAFATSLCSLALSYVAFEFAAPAIGKYSYIISWAVIGFFCFLQMRVMGPSRLKFKAGLAAALALMAIGAHTMFMFGMDSNQSQYDYNRERPC